MAFSFSPLERQRLSRFATTRFLFRFRGKRRNASPKASGDGGIILIKLEDSEKIEDFCDSDPFVKAGVQEYKVVEFKVFDIQKYAKEWV